MRCYRCMKEYSGESDTCPHCGYVTTAVKTTAYQLAPGTLLANRYWIGIVLGKGGFGITYKAYDTKLDIIVAIKEYYPVGLVKRDENSMEMQCKSQNKEVEFRLGLHRFLEEARNLAKFSKHPNIVDVFHFFKEHGTGYIVMEYLDGVSMKYFLKVNEGKMSVLYAKEIVLAVAGALETLHEAGILHRDVSPDNIFLCSDGKIKLIDFGASRLSDRDDSCQEVIVKPGYAPPEQYSKDAAQGAWTDLYALGATCYCAITGCIPPEAPERMKEDLLVRPCDWDENIPVYMDHIIRKAMALKPRERFASAKEMAEAIRQAKVVAVPKTQKEKQQQRKKYIRFGGCAGMLVLLIIGMVLCRQYVTPRGELLVWMCATEGADAKEQETYYTQMSERFAEQYPKMKVKVHVEDSDQYEDHLLQALQSDEAPEVYESTGMADEVYPYSEDLVRLAARLDERDSYYFLSRYQKYFPKARQIPVTFDMPVRYVLQGAEDNRDMHDQTIDENVYDGSEGQLQQFFAGRLAYLAGNASDYEEITVAYTQYLNANGRNAGAGVLQIEPAGNASASYRSVSVNGSGTHAQRKMAELYVEYLLSYEGQQALLEGDNLHSGLSVNCRLDGEDRKDIRKKLTVLEQQLETYR